MFEFLNNRITVEEYKALVDYIHYSQLSALIYSPKKVLEKS